jgi:ribosomal protein S18 acetylase RimI-like enzyme
MTDRPLTSSPIDTPQQSTVWRPMTRGDLAAVAAVAARVHVSYPEDDAVFAERLALYPDGCFVLDSRIGALGYMISHPWHLGQPPALNIMLGALPAPASTYYLHDLALLPQARGCGAGPRIVSLLAQHASTQQHRNISLVAVNNSLSFWRRQGFRVLQDQALSEKLASYDADACYMLRELAAS